MRYIKFILYLIKLYKPTKLIDKIHILQYKSINMYTSTISNKRVSTIEKNIIKYIDILDKYNKEDMVNGYITLPKVRSSRIVAYSHWYCDENYNMLTNDELQTWLSSAEIFVNRYMLCVQEIGKGIAYSNSVKLQSYIINIESIVDDILKYT